MAANTILNPALFEREDSNHRMHFKASLTGLGMICHLIAVVVALHTDAKHTQTLSVHTNNVSDCCLLIVGARRIAHEDAITQMAQHQQWRGFGLCLRTPTTFRTVAC